MTEVKTLLTDAIERLLKSTENNEASLWQAILDNEYIAIGLQDTGTKEEAFQLMTLFGRYAIQLPFGQVVVANWLKERYTMHDSQLAVIAYETNLKAERDDTYIRLSGNITALPVIGTALSILVFVEVEEHYYCVRIPYETLEFQLNKTLSQQQQVTYTLNDVVISLQDTKPIRKAEVELFKSYQITATTALLIGALEKMLELTVEFVKQRKQFGRPLASFQAIQQQLAIFAGEVGAAKTAFLNAIVEENQSIISASFAKVRASKAASISIPIAHQVHGAMGITEEYSLHHYTLNLAVWREQYGSERQLTIDLGKRAIASNVEELWSNFLS